MLLAGINLWSHSHIIHTTGALLLAATSAALLQSVVSFTPSAPFRTHGHSPRRHSATAATYLNTPLVVFKVHTLRNICTPAHIHAHRHTHKHTHTQTHVHTHIYTHTRTRTRDSQRHTIAFARAFSLSPVLFCLPCISVCFYLLSVSRSFFLSPFLSLSLSLCLSLSLTHTHTLTYSLEMNKYTLARVRTTYTRCMHPHLTPLHFFNIPPHVYICFVWCVCVCMCVCVCVGMCSYLLFCVCLCLCVCFLCVCICKCICMCIHTRVYVHVYVILIQRINIHPAIYGFVWHDIRAAHGSFIFARHDSIIRVTWLIYICDLTHFYVCVLFEVHDSFICARHDLCNELNILPWICHATHTWRSPPHTCIKHVTHIIESWYTFTSPRVILSHMNESSHTHDWVAHTRAWVTPHV